MIQRHRSQSRGLLLLLLFAWSPPVQVALAAETELRSEFANPTLRWQSRPLWFWNGKLDAEKTKGHGPVCQRYQCHGPACRVV
jgi:hypothetical protein